jgi:predicted dehydrogenase
MPDFVRRDFVKASAAGMTALSYQRVLGANERINLALIGCGGRGRGVARSMKEVAPNDVAYIAAADVYMTNTEQARTWAGADAKGFQDFRKVLDMKDVDAVHIATPDHWHAIASVMACQAGKDVYVEKPTSLTVKEGRAMVNAARKHNRIVQVGTQHRSAPHFMKIAEMIQRGDIGQVRFIRVWNYMNHTLGGGMRNRAGEQAPKDLDWDMYCGPSAKVPFDANRFLGSFRYFWDYSGGYITDFGNHRLDTMQQIMGVSAPNTVSASGGIYVMKDGRETPDFLSVTYEYDNFIVTYEGSNINTHGMGGRTPGHRYYNSRGEWDQPNGIAFYGTEATIFAERIGWEIFPEPEPMAGRRRAGIEEAPPAPRKRAAGVKRMWENVEEPTRAHCLNFVESVKARKTPHADIEIGHRGTSMCLLGNIAMKTGKKLRWDAKKEDFVGAPDASAMLSRSFRKPYDWIKV